MTKDTYVIIFIIGWALSDRLIEHFFNFNPDIFLEVTIFIIALAFFVLKIHYVRINFSELLLLSFVFYLIFVTCLVFNANAIVPIIRFYIFPLILLFVFKYCFINRFRYIKAINYVNLFVLSISLVFVYFRDSSPLFQPLSHVEHSFLDGHQNMNSGLFDSAWELGVYCVFSFLFSLYSHFIVKQSYLTVFNFFLSISSSLISGSRTSFLIILILLFLFVFVFYRNKSLMIITALAIIGGSIFLLFPDRIVFFFTELHLQNRFLELFTFFSLDSNSFTHFGLGAGAYGNVLLPLAERELIENSIVSEFYNYSYVKDSIFTLVFANFGFFGLLFFVFLSVYFVSILSRDLLYLILFKVDPFFFFKFSGAFVYLAYLLKGHSAFRSSALLVFCLFIFNLVKVEGSNEK